MHNLCLAYTLLGSNQDNFRRTYPIRHRVQRMKRVPDPFLNRVFKNFLEVCTMRDDGFREILLSILPDSLQCFSFTILKILVSIFSIGEFYMKHLIVVEKLCNSS